MSTDQPTMEHIVTTDENTQAAPDRKRILRGIPQPDQGAQLADSRSHAGNCHAGNCVESSALPADSSSNPQSFGVVSLDNVYAQNPNIVTRTIADECLLVPIKQTTGDLENIYVLNEVAGFVWNLVDGHTHLREIQKRLVEEFDVTEQAATEDLVGLIQALTVQGAVVLVAEPSSQANFNSTASC